MENGICTIKTAEDNISKDSNIFNFDYYISKGLLNSIDVNIGFYGNEEKVGYLKNMGNLNTFYDNLTFKINSIQKEIIEIKAETDVLILSIDTSLEEIKKLKTSLESYQDNVNSSVYKNLFEKLLAQENILIGAIGELFIKNTIYYDIVDDIAKSPITPYGFWLYK